MPSNTEFKAGAAAKEAEEISKWKPLLQGMNTRAMVRALANNYVTTKRELPSAERIRKDIAFYTEGETKPSTTTVQDEYDKWLADTFWPRFHALGSLPEDPQVPAELKRIYQEGFHQLVLGAMDAAGLAWAKDRDALTSERDEALRLSEEVGAKLLSAENVVGSQVSQIAELSEQVKMLSARLSEQQAAAALRKTDHELELARLQVQVQRQADEQIALVRGDLNRLQEELKEARQLANRLRSAIDIANTELNEERVRSATAAASTRSAKEDAAQTKADLEIKIRECRNLEIELASLKRDQSSMAPTIGRRLRKQGAVRGMKKG